MYIGIDLSIRETGLAMITKEKVILKVIKTDPQTFPNKDERIKHIIMTITNIISSNKYNNKEKIDGIAIEGLSFNSKGRSVLDLAMLQGAVRFYFTLIKQRYIIVPPATLKKEIAGNGRASKEDMQKALKVNYNQNIKNNNKADAFALALYVKER